MSTPLERLRLESAYIGGRANVSTADLALLLDVVEKAEEFLDNLTDDTESELESALARLSAPEGGEG